MIRIKRLFGDDLSELSAKADNWLANNSKYIQVISFNVVSSEVPGQKFAILICVHDNGHSVGSYV